MTSIKQFPSSLRLSIEPSSIDNLDTVKTLPLAKALKELPLPGLDHNLFSSDDWLNVIYKMYKTRLFVKYIARNGAVDSYIIYSVVKNFLEWKICVCSYCDYCDCHVASSKDWCLFVGSLKAEYPEYRIAIRNFRDQGVRKVPELRELSREKIHVLDVRADRNAVWQKTQNTFAGIIP